MLGATYYAGAVSLLLVLLCLWTLAQAAPARLACYAIIAAALLGSWDDHYAEGNTMNEDRVEQLAQILYEVTPENGTWRRTAGAVSRKRYTDLAQFVLARCDEFSIHNLLYGERPGLLPPPGAARAKGE